MKWQYLKEDVILIQSDRSYDWADSIRAQKIDGILEVVPGDGEVAIQFGNLDPEELIKKLTVITPEKTVSNQEVTIPVCYEKGLDWEEVCLQTGKTREEIIDLHLRGDYRVQYGFTPGFLYLTGLNSTLACKRKENPRTKLPAGSVGIGGEKTGIYSLESPGGWQIIGQTPMILFDISTKNPFVLENGAKVKFERITPEAYDEIRDSN